MQSPLKSQLSSSQSKILFYFNLIRLPWICSGRIAGLWWYHMALGLVHYIVILPFIHLDFPGVLWKFLGQHAISGRAEMEDGISMSQRNSRIPNSTVCSSFWTHWPRIDMEMFQTRRLHGFYSSIPVIIRALRFLQSSSSPKSKHKDTLLYSKDHMQLISSDRTLGLVARKQLMVQRSTLVSF